MLPSTITLKHYYRALTETLIVKSIVDTFIYSAASAGIVTVISAFAAYAFAYFRFPAKRTLFLLLACIQTIPGWAIIVPMFLYIRLLNLYDTYLALIFSQGGWCLPFSVLVMIGFMKSIPWQLHEAALIDGCSDIIALRRIILPLTVPGIVAVVVYSFITCWGEFVWPLVLTSTNVITAPVVISQAVGQWGADYNLICTQGALSIISPIIYSSYNI